MKSPFDHVVWFGRAKLESCLLLERWVCSGCGLPPTTAQHTQRARKRTLNPDSLKVPRESRAIQGAPWVGCGSVMIVDPRLDGMV